MKPTLVLLSGMGAVLTEITQKYFFSDFEYLKYLLIAVTLDLLTGIAKVWAKDGVSAITSKGFRMTIIKFIQYGSFLIITHVLASFKVGGQGYPHFAFIKEWAYMLLLLIEIKSVYENLVSISPRMDFVKGIIEKINNVTKNSKTKE